MARRAVEHLVTMRSPGVRALSLLFAVAAAFAFRPAGAASSNAQALEVRLIDGGSHYPAGGTGFVSITITQGATSDADGTLLGTGARAKDEYYACISVNTAVGRDVGCDYVPAAKVVMDPALNMASVALTVRSQGHPGKTLSANVTIIGRSTPAVQFNPLDAQVLPPPPASGVRYVGPVVSLERWGTVSGRITSQFAGGGDIVAYTGPPTPDAVASLSQGIVPNAHRAHDVRAVALTRYR
jgi:hypothetical protein